MKKKKKKKKKKLINVLCTQPHTHSKYKEDSCLVLKREGKLSRIVTELVELHPIPEYVTKGLSRSLEYCVFRSNNDELLTVPETVSRGSPNSAEHDANSFNHSRHRN